MKRTLLSSLFSITSILLLAQCFDLTNLNSSSITCTFGNYDNPYMYTGVANNRHTVNTDVNAYDANVSQLKVIPEGESVSIRLGNDKTGAEAESITFEYVPNSANPVLLLKYAAVMQNPNHTSNEQPRMKMEVMDAEGNAIDKDCMSFDFIANESLGWNAITQGDGGYFGKRVTILWKDWTSIGVNMMPYIGKKLRIRLTTYDCAKGGHYGYAYIHLGCQSNKIQSSACGNLTSSTFSAPAGFEYRWYKKQGDGEVERGTAQSISVPMDGDEYFCDISQIGKPGCSFTLSVVAEPRYALSRFDIKKVSGCADTIYLTNKSCVSSDGSTPYLPLTDCDEAIWDLGDGRQLTTYQLSTTPITYSKGGTYTISLTAKLAGEGSCIDIHTEKVSVRGTDDDHTGHIYETICEGSYYNFGGQRIVQTGEYRKADKTALGCDSTTVLHLTCKPAFLLEDSVFLCPNEQYDFRGRVVTRSGTYYDRLQSSLGCDSTYRLIVHVRPTALSTDTVHVCRNDSALLHGRWVSQEGTYVDTLRTRVTGCDSICRTVVRHLPQDTTRLTVTVCDNEPYAFNGKQYNSTGTYYARYKNAEGCDSTVVLTLHVLPTYLQTQYVEVCHDETFEFRGRVLDAPGVYYDSLLTQTGCDSVFKIVFNKTPIYLFEDTATICDGEFFDFRGRKVSQPGYYYDTLQTVSGCDSIFKTLLHVKHTVYATDTVHVCRNDSALLHGRWVSQEGTYVDTLRTRVTGCDSICRTVVRHLPQDTTRLTVTVCDNEPYAFNGKQYNSTGTYYARYKNAEGCDSTVVLTLHVLPTYLQTQYVEVCHDETFEFRGRVLDAPGVYYDSLLTQTGCDSVFKIVFNKTPIYLFEDTATICDGEFFDFRGRKVSQPGYYYDTLQTVSGCDSIFRLLLKVSRTFYQRMDTTICGTYYDFRGKYLYESGTYYDSIKTYSGCDSVYQLNLTIHPSYLYPTYIEQCEGESFIFRGKTYTEPGIYYDSLLTCNGCDSVYMLVYNRTPTYLFETEATVCSNKSYNFRGQQIDKPGVYYDRLETVSGCDSVFKLTLTHNQSYFFSEQKAGSTCDDQTYLFRGREITQSGVYYDSLQTSCGCDSIYRLEIVLNQSYMFNEVAHICDYERYRFRGKYYSATGVYMDSLVTFAGCDSIYRLELYVSPTHYDTLVDSICAGSSYSFGGRLLYNSGYYTDTLYDPVGNLCTISSLHLTAKPATVLTSVSDVSSCADDREYSIGCKFYGSAPARYSILYDSVAHLYGFEDIIDRHSVDGIVGDIPQYRNHDEYIRPDYYNARLVVDNGVCDAVGEGIPFRLLVKYPSWIIEQNWGDVVATLNERYNGGYTFDSYQWNVNGRDVGDNWPNLYMPELMAGDEVVLYLVRSGESYALPTCPITIEAWSSSDGSDFPVMLSPTSVSRSHARINIRAKASGSYDIYDMMGKHVGSASYQVGDSDMDIPSVSGCYIIVLHAEGNTKSTKVVVY